jgi:hypothetical protein
MLLALALCPFIFHLTPTWLFPPSLFRHHPSCLHPWFSCCQNQWYITFNFFILLNFLSNGWFSFVMWGTFFKILWQRCSWIILFLFSFFQDYFFLYLFVLVTTMKYLRHTNLERKEACWTLCFEAWRSEQLAAVSVKCLSWPHHIMAGVHMCMSASVCFLSPYKDIKI